jgi:hypothetical protein
VRPFASRSRYSRLRDGDVGAGRRQSIGPARSIRARAARGSASFTARPAPDGIVVGVLALHEHRW